MDIPKLKHVPAVRFVAATLALVGLYVGLDNAAFWLFLQGSELSSAKALGLGASQAEIDAVNSASMPREAALPPSHRLAAFDLGVRMGFAASMAGQSTSPGFSAEQRAAAVREAQDFVDEGGLARTLIGTDAKVLHSANFSEWSRLPQRIEKDEAGLAARIEGATTPRHRHLVLLGMQIGRTVWSPKGLPEMLGEPLADAIATHASLAGLPKRLWEPLVYVPRVGTAAERRAGYETAVEALRQALLSSPPWY